MKLEMEVKPWGVGDSTERYLLNAGINLSSGAGEESIIAIRITPKVDAESDGPWETIIELELPEAKRLFAELGVMVAILELESAKEA